MKKFLSFMLTLLTIITFGISLNVQAANDVNYTYTFSSTSGMVNNKSADLNGISWNLVTDSPYVQNEDANGLHIGSGSNALKSILLETVQFKGTVSKISLHVKTNSSKNHTITTSVGSASFGSKTFGKGDFTLDFNGTATGDVSINIDRSASEKKYIYIYSISLVYSLTSATDYTVSFNANGAQFVEGKGQTITTTLGQPCPAITLPVESDLVIPSNLIFKGWTDGTNTFKGGEVVTPEIDVNTTYKALFNKVTTTIKEAVDICVAQGNKETTESYTILGEVTSTDNNGFYIKDKENNELYVFKANITKPTIGTFVEITGKLLDYTGKSGTKHEIKNGIVEIVDIYKEFNNNLTQSGLAITYDDTTSVASNVKIRFGGIITDYSFNSLNQYGVIVLPGSNTDDLTNLTDAKLTEYRTLGYVVDADPVRVNGGYQFAWRIPNMEGHYDFEFRAVMFMKDGTKISISKETKNSVLSVRDIYLNNPDLASLYDVLNSIK